MLPEMRTAGKALRKGREWSISICAVIFLLLSGTCFAASPYAHGAYDTIHTPGLNGSPCLAFQSRPGAPIFLGKAPDRTGSFSWGSLSAAVSAGDLPLTHFPARTIESDHAGFSILNLAGSAIQVRAPPAHFPAGSL